MLSGFPFDIRRTIQWNEIICRIANLKGGLIYLTTPHGTLIRVGFCDFAKFAKPVQDRQRAAWLWRDSRRKNKE